MAKSGSSSTLTDKNRFSQPDPTPTPRPPMRARGMTDSGANPRSAFLRQEGSPSKVPRSQKLPSPSHQAVSPTASPRVIIRQPSVSRIGSPPSAPPKHELPPPPLDHVVKGVGEMIIDPFTGSASSSTLSFASSVSSNRDILVNQSYSPRQKEKKPAERPLFPSAKADADRAKAPQNQATVQRTLKKALSHQSLVKHIPSSQSPLSTPLTERVVEKIPRKQRSFHQPKVPIPPVPPPMHHANSFGSQPLIPSSSTSTPVIEQRRGSAGGISTSGRKRLFSGSSSLRRPSTSQCIMSEDDSLSVFSVRSDQDSRPGVSFFNPLSPTPTSSFWDENGHETAPTSPNPAAHEYTPKQIMSPAEMAEVEASVEESSTHIRKRGLSILSASTIMTTDGDEETASTNLAPQPLVWDTGKPDSLLARSTSLLDKGLTVPPRLGLRPSTSQANMTTSASVATPKSPSPTLRPPSHAMTSLPPPPRPRQRPMVVPQSTSEDRVVVTSLPPPPARRYLRPKVSVEKALHHRSIMRKPSFLEIDDDTDKESDDESTREPMNSSFLDLARESFDTVRTISE
jgi:hypothetical protein